MAAPLLTPDVWSRVVADHDAYWEDLRAELRLNQMMYELRYWDRKSAERASSQGGQNALGLLLVETSRMYEFVEGYQASLFSKEPAVVVRADIRGRGNAEVVQAACNDFLLRTRTTIESASRAGILAPTSYCKLAATENEDPYRRVETAVIPGWDVILDTSAKSWETQRYIGHRYWTSINEAQDRWGKKDYAAVERIDFLDRVSAQTPQRRKLRAHAPTADILHQYIEAVEVYDLLSDRLLIWSPQWKQGTEWLDAGRKVIVEGVERLFDRIPFRTPSDRPLVPLAQLIYARRPFKPMEGIASARRVYDQCQEVNVSRTFQANGTRKAARQWFAARGRLSPDDMARIVQGIDGEIIEVDLMPGESLASLLAPIPQADTPPEIETYVKQVQHDLDRGSVLAPFTRGEGSGGASASEITALASYSASEVGRLARERDGFIEQIARIYASILGLYIADEGTDLVLLDGTAVTVKPEDFQGDFAFFAKDGGSTPVSQAQHKADLTAAVPTLQALGVPNDVLLKELVRVLGLPETFVPSAMQPASAGQPAPAPRKGEAPANLTGAPSPANIARILGAR